MLLYVRMALYAIFSILAAHGVGVYDNDAGTLTLQIDQLAQVVTGVLGYVVTFITSRIAYNRGGAT